MNGANNKMPEIKKKSRHTGEALKKMLLQNSKHFLFSSLATHGLYLFNMHEVGKNKRFLSQVTT